MLHPSPRSMCNSLATARGGAPLSVRIPSPLTAWAEALIAPRTPLSPQSSKQTLAIVNEVVELQSLLTRCSDDSADVFDTVNEVDPAIINHVHRSISKTQGQVGMAPPSACVGCGNAVRLVSIRGTSECACPATMCYLCIARWIHRERRNAAAGNTCPTCRARFVVDDLCIARG